MQTRIMSLIEAATNTVIGFVVNFTANLLILPIIFGIRVTIAENMVLGLIFTVISVVRGYLLRRFFNGHLKNFSRFVGKMLHR